MSNLKIRSRWPDSHEMVSEITGAVQTSKADAGELSKGIEMLKCSAFIATSGDKFKNLFLPGG